MEKVTKKQKEKFVGDFAEFLKKYNLCDIDTIIYYTTLTNEEFIDIDFNSGEYWRFNVTNKSIIEIAEIITKELNQ